MGLDNPGCLKGALTTRVDELDQVGPQEQHVADAVWRRLLRHRDDRPRCRRATISRASAAEAIRFSPRQADLMIVSGRISIKMMPVLTKIWEQMPEPKWCISMGACASCGGIFDTYALVQGVDNFIPVDVYVPGCPRRVPESLIDAADEDPGDGRQGEAASAARRDRGPAPRLKPLRGP